jgi:hypothetical protein
MKGLRIMWSRLSQSEKMRRNFEVATVIQFRLVFCMTFNVLRKPILKLLKRIKQLWHEEVQQRPKLRVRGASSTLPLPLSSE